VGPEERSFQKERFVFVSKEIGNATMSYVKSRMLICLIVGILTAIGFYLLGLPYGILLGLLIGFLNLFPILPLVFGLLPAMIIGYFADHNIWMSVWVLVVFSITQFLDGFVLSPIIQGKMVGLHPLTTFIVVGLASVVFGFIGLIFAVPVAVAMKILFREFYRPRPVNYYGRKKVTVEEIKDYTARG
jgi:predicted PurR-regulated permease PerM